MKIQLKQIKIRDLTNQYKDLKTRASGDMVVYWIFSQHISANSFIKTLKKSQSFKQCVMVFL